MNMFEISQFFAYFLLVQFAYCLLIYILILSKQCVNGDVLLDKKTNQSITGIGGKWPVGISNWRSWIWRMDCWWAKHSLLA